MRILIFVLGRDGRNDCMHHTSCWVLHTNKPEQALETVLVTRFDISLLVPSIFGKYSSFFFGFGITPSIIQVQNLILLQ